MWCVDRLGSFRGSRKQPVFAGISLPGKRLARLAKCLGGFLVPVEVEAVLLGDTGLWSYLELCI